MLTVTIAVANNGWTLLTICVIVWHDQVYRSEAMETKMDSQSGKQHNLRGSHHRKDIDVRGQKLVYEGMKTPQSVTTN